MAFSIKCGKFTPLWLTPAASHSPQPIVLLDCHCCRCRSQAYARALQKLNKARDPFVSLQLSNYTGTELRQKSKAVCCHCSGHTKALLVFRLAFGRNVALNITGRGVLGDSADSIHDFDK